MIKESRFKIVVVDKKSNFPFLFHGIRKNKYTVTRIATVKELLSNELTSFNLFFVVLYEFKDVFELLLLNSTSSSIIVGSQNAIILKKLKSAGCYPVVDLSGNVFNVNTSFYDCVKEFFG